MDINVLVNKIKELFIIHNKTQKNKYSEVWLREVDFGGLINWERYTLCAKAAYGIELKGNARAQIIDLIWDNLNGEHEYIWTVSVYKMDERVCCQKDDIMILEEVFD